MTTNAAIEHVHFHSQCQHMHVNISVCIKYNNLICKFNMLMLCVLPNSILTIISSYTVLDFGVCCIREFVCYGNHRTVPQELFSNL